MGIMGELPKATPVIVAVGAWKLRAVGRRDGAATVKADWAWFGGTGRRGECRRPGRDEGPWIGWDGGRVGTERAEAGRPVAKLGGGDA
jgi:hypothetical protein